MNSSELDQAYTHLCHTMTRIGEPEAKLFLARLALLAVNRFEDAQAAMAWIDAAAADVTSEAGQ